MDINAKIDKLEKSLHCGSNYFASVDNLQPKRDFFIKNKEPENNPANVVRVDSIEEAKTIVSRMTNQKKIDNIFNLKGVDKNKPLYLGISILKEI